MRRAVPISTTMECCHFHSANFQPEAVLKQMKRADEKERFCSICSLDTESKWLCLACGTISCGRYVKGHALEHFKKTGHQLALDMESKACHW